MYQADLPEIVTHNQTALNNLKRALTLGGGQFSLILVRSNYQRLTQLLLSYLMQSQNFRLVQLSGDDQSLAEAICSRQLSLEQPPAAVMVTGFDQVALLDDFFKGANVGRNALLSKFPCPVVFWMTDAVLQTLTVAAADLKSFAAVPIRVDYPIQALIEALHRAATELFGYILDSHDSQFLEYSALALPSLSAHLRVLTEQELPFAIADLHQHAAHLDGALQASLTFLQGRDAHTPGRLKVAREYYEASLDYWLQTDKTVEDTSDQQAVLLLHLGLWWQKQAELKRSTHITSYQKARRFYERFLDVFRQQQRYERVGTFLHVLAEVLQDLEDWDALTILANEGIDLHQDDPVRLARDYGYLAEAALAKEDHIKAQTCATEALNLLAQAVKSTQVLGATVTDSPTTVPKISPQSVVLALRYHQGRYYFLRGQAKVKQGDDKLFNDALNDLENARQRTEPRHDFPLYRDILRNLQSLYFAKQRYLDAFAIKQEQRQVENLMGLRAFIGASAIQPYRSTGTDISPVEMRASGRQQAVEELVGRLMQPQHTLVIIHGQSGVGKSSLLSSGLVPALKQATSEGRTTLPLLVRNYLSWEVSILQALQRVTSSQPSAPPNFKVSFPITGESLLVHLSQHAQDNYQQVVLVFDQFEEFFFERPGVEQRRSLYYFLRDCLNQPYLKVVMALRDDYLHYLMEWERFASLDLDILSRDVRYYLGNFNRQECEAVIRQLTENAQFYLEEDLIATLVADLTVDDGEVRPIELQVVGAELQREAITTLRRYKKELGDDPILTLVRNFLNRVVEDCGPENTQLARTILYLLSDETTTRPLKTLTELEESLESLSILVDPAQLDLVLEILAESGLLFKNREVGGSVRYQLAHDYLADLVKQQDIPGLMTVLQAERRRRKQTETQLRTALQEQALALAQATEERYRAETAEMQALASVSQALLLSHDGLGALLEALKGAQQTRLTPISDYLQNQILFRLWQALHTVRERNRVHAHQDWVLAACFSPDDQYMASSSDDGTVRLWNAHGKLLQVLRGHQGSVLDVAFSHDSQLIGSAGDDFTVRLWDLAGQCVHCLTGHTGTVNSVAFSPTHKLIASASNDHTVRLWTQDGQWLKTLEGHLDWVRSVAFSTDGHHLVSAAEDGTLCLWNSEGELLQTISSHAGWVLQAVFSPDGQFIASGGDDHLIKLWNLKGELLQYFDGHQNWVRDLCFSPDGSRLMSASDDQHIHVWDLKGKLLDTLKGHRSSVLSLAINSQGSQLISASDDNTIRLWQLAPREGPKLEAHHGIIWDVCWQPQGLKLISAGADQTLRVWDSDSGDNSLLQTIAGHHSSIYSVDWSPDGQVIASASADHTVKLWADDGRLLNTFQGHHNAVWSVKFSPDGTYLASAGSDRNIRLWDTDGNSLGQLSGHGGTVWTVAFSPDGRYLVSGSEDGTLRRWDLEGVKTGDTPFTEQTGEILAGHTGSVWAVAVAPDGETIASAGSDNTVRLWKNGEQMHILRGHHDWVRSVSFGLGGNVVASASDDGTIRFWQTSGQLLHTLKGHRGIIWQASFNSAGNQLASAGADGQVRLWNLDMGQLMRQSCQWIADYLAYGDLSDGDRRVCEDYWD